MKLRGWVAPSALVMVVVLAGCSRADPRILVIEPAPDGSAQPVAAGPTNLEISADPSGQLAYTTAQLQAVAGQPVTVAFTNPDTAGQPHNWVLVQPGQEQAVVQAALPNQGNVPEGTPGALAAGAILQPGQSETITSNQPVQAGEYTYLCTFPGHYPAMQGTLVVGEATAGTDGSEAGGAEGGDADAAGGAAAGGLAVTDGSVAIAADPNGLLAFQQPAFTATAEQPFTVNFENPSTSGLPHNFVVVDQGQEDVVAQAALPNQGNVPEGTPGVRAAGNIIQPGNNEEIDVPGLPAGEYSYVCTFPGHSTTMRGTITVAQ